jgi:2-keto-3-deoxy-L-rhamnonate aldolase RhmA
MYITNKPEVAKIAYNAGVDRIFVDLETIGKSERQGGMDTVQSHHTLDDVRTIRLTFSGELLVRANHIYENSKKEIDAIINRGADVVMLPYFKTVNEAAKFIDIVNGRAKVSLLVETPEAVDKLDSILDLEGIDEIHVGLNDLHLAYHRKFMFELLTDGTVEMIAHRVHKKGIKFGFGGIARIGKGIVPAEKIIREHYRLGSTCAILSRAFCNTDIITDLTEIRAIFEEGIVEIRCLEKEACSHLDYFNKNRNDIRESVNDFINHRQ